MQYQRIRRIAESAVIASLITTCMIVTSVKADAVEETSTESIQEETQTSINFNEKVVLVLQESNDTASADLSQVLTEINNISVKPEEEPEEEIQEEVIEEAIEEVEEELTEEINPAPTPVPGESYSNMIHHEHNIVVDPIIIEKTSYIMYPTTDLNVREYPNTECNVIGGLTIKDEIEVIGEIPGNTFVQIMYNGEEAFVSSEYLSEEQTKPKVAEYHWDGKVLSKGIGTVQGPSGKETYYNQNMSGVIRLMNHLGYYDEYWVNDEIGRAHV